MSHNYSKPLKENRKFYALFYFKTGEFKMVSKKVFSKLSYPTFDYEWCVVRVVDSPSRKASSQSLNKILPDMYHGQGLFSKMSGAMDDISSLSSCFMSAVATVKGLDKKSIVKFLSIFFKITALFGERTFNASNVVSIVLDLYLIYLETQFEAQGIEAMASIAMASFMPEQLFNIIRKSQVLSSSKLIDDSSVFHDFIVSIVGGVEWCLGKLKLPSRIELFVKNVLDMFRDSSIHFVVKKMEEILVLGQNCKKFVDLSFRAESKRIDEKLKKLHQIKEWAKRSPVLADLLMKWGRHMKIISVYEAPDRIEPACFVFEGPPGKRKSVLMNAVIQVLGEPFYAHCVKAVSDGKDFYDNYNNEPIFYMDDVGQNGPSQWRPLMNMVSSVKLPLDCAEAQNKDTKFFNSTKIFLTTNRFQTLNINLSKNDCIDDITALWRRGLVFDFSQLYVAGDSYRGQMSFKYFNLDKQKFVVDFPPAMKKEIEARNIRLSPILDVEDRSQLIAWMCKIIKINDLLKLHYKNENTLSSSELSTIRDEIESIEFHDAKFEAQAESNSYLSELLCSIFSEMFEVMLSVFNEIKDFVYDNILWISAIGFIGLMLYTVWLLDDSSSDKAKSKEACDFLLSRLSDGTALVYENETGKVVVKEFEGQGFKYDEQNVHNSILSVKKAVKVIEIKEGDTTVRANALVSGRSIIVPAHLIHGSSVHVVIYADFVRNSRLVDDELVRVVFKDNSQDVAILKLPRSYPSPFKNFSHHFKDSGCVEEQSYLINENIIYPIGNKKLENKISYAFSKPQCPDYKNCIENGCSYDLQYKGLCGSIVMSQVGGISGFHVAGNPATNTGVAITWSPDIRKVIKGFLDEDKNLLPIEVSPKVQENTSVIKLDRKMSQLAMLKTELGPSPLFGIYPISRSPAKLDVFGKFTTKHIGKSAFAIPGSVPIEEIEFARKTSQFMFGDFGDLPWDEVVKGNELLNGLNKDSSNGFSCFKEKDYYINFEQGCLTPECLKIIEDLENAVEQGTMSVEHWEKFFWIETPKDEVRSDSKEGVPRTFRVGTIVQQILAKRYFGRFVESVLQNRSLNQVMVGINPVKEWPMMYQKLVKGKVFAGDVAKWDKGMIPRFQRALFEEIMAKYKGSKPKVAEVVLECLIHSLVVMVDDLYLTTHSLASGHFLTAIFNSLINRMYTAGWYYREMTKAGRKFGEISFFQDLIDFVYGDDKLNSIYKHCDILNAITMRNYFESMGLGFTDASKNPITRPFQDIGEVSFLKRSFVFHNELDRIVCPLELEVLKSGLSWVNYGKDIELVMQQKINNFQREIYLHVDREFLLVDFCNRLESRNYPFEVLSNLYLKKLYDINSDYEPSFGCNLF